MREDEYGTLLERTLQTTDQPLTAADLRERVGCSRQRVYTWLQANEHRIHTVGKDRRGGALYEWIGDAQQATVMSDTFQLTGVKVVDHEVVLVLRGPDGTQYHARPA